MPPIDPRLVTARRFPVHAAVDRCNEAEVRRLVDEDAGFHLPRKIPEKEASVVHTACMARPGPEGVVVGILKYLIQVRLQEGIDLLCDDGVGATKCGSPSYLTLLLLTRS